MRCAYCDGGSPPFATDADGDRVCRDGTGCAVRQQPAQPQPEPRKQWRVPPRRTLPDRTVARILAVYAETGSYAQASIAARVSRSTVHRVLERSGVARRAQRLTDG